MSKVVPRYQIYSPKQGKWIEAPHPPSGVMVLLNPVSTYKDRKVLEVSIKYDDDSTTRWRQI